MQAIRAGKIIVDSDTIRTDSVILSEHGKIKSIIDFEEFSSSYPSVNYFYQENSICCAGFVNCHTHTELSADPRLDDFASFTDWIKKLMMNRMNQTEEEQKDAAEHAIEEAFKNGTIAFADISNTGMMIDFFEKKRIAAFTFLEVLGFQSQRAHEIYNNCLIKFADYLDRPNVVLTPHSPYGVSVQLMKQLKHSRKLQSIHIDESPAERIFLESGSGELCKFLENIAVWDENWKVPATDPYRYLDQFGFLQNTLLVHCLNLQESELNLLKDRHARIVLCPRSNQFLHHKQPDYDLFKNCDFALGTDSLASADDLSILNEMRFLKQESDLESKTIFKAASQNGAEFMNFIGLGSLANAKDAICNYFTYPVLSANPIDQLVSEVELTHKVINYVE
ncbi:MAG: amidohydrolase family protein [Calditrichaeota bacterium]|nr:amidohydrolase family protein [Calditrichota bacterium]